MFLVCVRTVFSDTTSSRAISGPSRSVSDHPEHLQLAFAQWLNQDLLDGAVVLGLGHSGQGEADIVPGDRPVSRPALSREAVGGPSSTKIQT